MNRVSFFVDGFNLYHSTRDAESYSSGASTKWLDSLGGVHYFSAMAHHLTRFDPDVVARHKAFSECLSDTGISVELARFKPKKVKCPICGKQTTHYEEKETDVAIAVSLMESLHMGACVRTPGCQPGDDADEHRDRGELVLINGA